MLLNERKFRIFSEAAPGGGRQLHAPPGERAVQLAAAPGRWRFSPPSPLFPDPWLRAELLGLETDQCPLPPLALSPDSPSQHTGNVPISEFFADGRQGRSRGHQGGPASSVGGLHIPISSLRGYERHPSPPPPLKHPQGFDGPKSETRTATLSRPHALTAQPRPPAF